ncbi:hypothetical protein SISSUDRAFT_1042898 [Sistotremastrum suecicum HHB10207 ss-3]|uniref:LCCL domain-containing protein n=1 Tax=Sistotremastrum suecicum HHB10207 ss-3 TaxID=1314776 RepID=A0A166G5A0_9AGAM|nr:hypothetical protein SISSUDRAFT_1042898 [Sistotremastrum suecicum HHB10207 ss-3]
MESRAESSLSSQSIPRFEKEANEVTRPSQTTFELEYSDGLPTVAGQDRPRLPRPAQFSIFPSWKPPSIVTKALRYINGPNPRVSIPDPMPWLEREYHLRYFRFSLHLETRLKKLTRPLASLWIFALFAAAYIVSLAFLVRSQAFLTPADSYVTCTSTYWLPDAGCGLDGSQCEPFDNSTFEFRCPSGCSTTILQNPRAVGDQEPVFVPLIIGGGDQNTNGSSGTYRGDSFICASAIHAGIISNSRGGCGTLSLVANFTDFVSSTAHGLTSTAFPSVFPLSFVFTPSSSLNHCEDLRNDALAFNIIVTCILFLLLSPPPIVAFWSLVCIGFWHVTFFSQPRENPPPISDAFGTFLPALFVAYAFWRVAWRKVLPSFSNIPLERAIWYLAPFWAGVEVNVITDKIPVDRLIASDIRERHGALAAVIIIALVLLVLVVNQVRVIRKTGLLPFYILCYVAAALTVLVFSQMPGLEFHLHHYFAAIALIPIAFLPTRLSAIYQAFLLGMFLNGVAAFDFASIFETHAEIVRDGAVGSELPTFATNSTGWNSSLPLVNQTISWNPFPDDDNDWDSFSLMVDDVERLASNALNYSLALLQPGIPHFFRLAFSSDGVSGDYTRAAIVLANGSWIDPPSGASE